jgi:hypothetical protein
MNDDMFFSNKVSRRRCGRGEPSPGADVVAGSPFPARMSERQVERSDFYDPAGIPQVSFQEAWGRHSCGEELGPNDRGMAYIWHSKNLNCLLDKRFGMKRRYNPLHQAYPLTRGLMRQLRSEYPEVVAETVSYRFRNRRGVIPHYLALWTGIYTGQVARRSDRIACLWATGGIYIDIYNMSGPVDCQAIPLHPRLFPSHFSIRFYGHRIFDHVNFEKFERLRPRPKVRKEPWELLNLTPNCIRDGIGCATSFARYCVPSPRRYMT